MTANVAGTTDTEVSWLDTLLSSQFEVVAELDLDTSEVNVKFENGLYFNGAKWTGSYSEFISKLTSCGAEGNLLERMPFTWVCDCIEKNDRCRKLISWTAGNKVGKVYSLEVTCHAQVKKKGLLVLQELHDERRGVTDFTEEISNLAQQAKQRNDMWMRAFSEMSHDIRSPLNAIYSLSTEEITEMSDVESMAKSLSIINNSAMELLSIVNEVLELAVLDNEKVTQRRKNFSCSAECEKFSSVASNVFALRNQTLLIEKKMEQDYFSGDPDKLKHILLNLLGNAAKYSPEGSVARLCMEEIGSEESGDYALKFTITDEGIGMNAEELKHACDPFYRSSRSVVSGIQGTGLGLSIVKKTIESLGGSLQIESKIGLGTKVTVVYPVSSAKSGSCERGDASKNDITGILADKRVLLVDDQQVNIMIGEKLMFIAGADVTIAVGGQEAVNAYDTSFDLILMDKHMPVVNGVEATKMIRDMEKAYGYKPVKILGLTSSIELSEIQECLEAGMDNVISKPLNFGKLIQIIKEFNFGVE